MIRTNVAILMVVVLAAAVGEAKADAITTYSDRTAFDSAVGSPLTVETFTSSYHYPISTGVLNSSTNLIVANGSPILPGDIQPGVTYSTAIGQSFFFNIDEGGGFDGGFLDGFNQTFPNVLTTTFDAPVTAFGFDTDELMGSSFSIAIQFLNGPNYTNSFTVPASEGLSFYGFQSSAQDITSAQILGVGGANFSFALDNFTFSQPAVATPEPASLTLLASGFFAAGGFGLYRRRREV